MTFLKIQIDSVTQISLVDASLKSQIGTLIYEAYGYELVLTLANKFGHLKRTRT